MALRGGSAEPLGSPVAPPIVGAAQEGQTSGDGLLIRRKSEEFASSRRRCFFSKGGRRPAEW